MNTIHNNNRNNPICEFIPQNYPPNKLNVVNQLIIRGVL